MSKAQGICHKYGMTHNKTKCIDNLYAKLEGKSVLLY